MFLLTLFVTSVFSACDTFDVSPCDDFTFISPTDVNEAFVGVDKDFMVARGQANNDLLHVYLPGTTAGPVDYAAYMDYSVDKAEAVIGLSYVWGPKVGETNGVCNGMPDPSECWYKYHEYIMYGEVMEASASFDPAAFEQFQLEKKLDDEIYNKFNAAIPRLRGLLEYLAAQDQYWSKWMNADGTLKWEKFILSGHSQGGCHVAYLAHEYEVATAIMHSAPGEENVSWMTDFATPTMEGRFYGTTSTKEGGMATFKANWESMTTLFFEYDGEPNPAKATAYHGSTLWDPAFPCIEIPLADHDETCVFVAAWDQMFDTTKQCLDEVCEGCQKDTEGFTDAHGHTCEDWRGFDCTMGTFENFQYSEEELENIQENCCMACKKYQEAVMGLDKEKCNWHSRQIPCYYWHDEALIAEYDMNMAIPAGESETKYIDAEDMGNAHEVTMVPGGNVWITHQYGSSLTEFVGLRGSQASDVTAVRYTLPEGSGAHSLYVSNLRSEYGFLTLEYTDQIALWNFNTKTIDYTWTIPLADFDVTQKEGSPGVMMAHTLTLDASGNLFITCKHAQYELADGSGDIGQGGILRLSNPLKLNDANEYEPNPDATWYFWKASDHGKGAKTVPFYIDRDPSGRYIWFNCFISDEVGVIDTTMPDETAMSVFSVPIGDDFPLGVWTSRETSRQFASMPSAMVVLPSGEAIFALYNSLGMIAKVGLDGTTTLKRVCSEPECNLAYLHVSADPTMVAQGMFSLTLQSSTGDYAGYPSPTYGDTWKVSETSDTIVHLTGFDPETMTWRQMMSYDAPTQGAIFHRSFEEHEADGSDFIVTTMLKADRILVAWINNKPMWDSMSAKTSETCVDDYSFVDANGLSCAAWYTLDCSQTVFGDITYTSADVAEVQANCCKACSYYKERSTFGHSSLCNWKSETVPCWYFDDHGLVAEYNLDYATVDGEVKSFTQAGSTHEITFGAPDGSIWVTSQKANALTRIDGFQDDNHLNPTIERWELPSQNTEVGDGVHSMLVSAVDPHLAFLTLEYNDQIGLWSFTRNEIVHRWDISQYFDTWGVSQNEKEPAVLMAHTLVEANGDLYITCKKAMYDLKDGSGQGQGGVLKITAPLNPETGAINGSPDMYFWKISDYGNGGNSIPFYIEKSPDGKYVWANTYLSSQAVVIDTSVAEDVAMSSHAINIDGINPKGSSASNNALYSSRASAMAVTKEGCAIVALYVALGHIAKVCPDGQIDFLAVPSEGDESNLKGYLHASAEYKDVEDGIFDLVLTVSTNAFPGYSNDFNENFVVSDQKDEVVVLRNFDPTSMTFESQVNYLAPTQHAYLHRSWQEHQENGEDFIVTSQLLSDRVLVSWLNLENPHNNADTDVSAKFAPKADQLTLKGVELLGDVSKVIQMPMEAEVLGSDFMWIESPHQIGNTVYFSSVVDRNDDNLSTGNLYAFDLETMKLSIAIEESGIFGGTDGTMTTSDRTGENMIAADKTGVQPHTAVWNELGSNGMFPYTDPEGMRWLILAQHGNQRIVKLPMDKIEDGTIDDADVVVLADEYNGVSLNSPNDMVVMDDKLFFTDPPFGLIRGEGYDIKSILFAAPQPNCNVYCLDLVTGDLEAIIPFPNGDLDATVPNGIGLYGNKMVVATTWPTAAWKVYEKSENGEWTEQYHWDLVEMGGTPAASVEGAFCDGLSIKDNYMFGSCTGGVYIFDLDADYADAFVGQIYVDDNVSNNFVADDYIYLTANSNLIRLKLATTGGAYTCGSTMEECEAAYLAASTPAISVMEPTMTLDGCDELDSSWVNNVVNGLSGWDSDSMKLCANNGQYAVEVDGMVYPTCVAYGTQGTACTDDSLVCPDRNADPGVFGYAGNVRNALTSSMTRADFGHPQCPTATCLTMDSIAESNRYWKDQVLNQPFTDVTEAQVDALCVNEDNQVMVVTREGKCNTCIGWNTDATAQCESGKFLCAGHSGEGEFTYGWPGQIARTLAVAAVNADGMYMHPQCPLMICKA